MRRRSPVAARGLATIGLLLAIMIAALAVPRLLSAFALLPGSAALALVQAGTRPSDAGLQRAVAAQAAGLAALPRAETHLDAALLALSLAEGATLPAEEEAELLGIARHHLGAALRRSPAQARGWLMATALELGAGERAAAARSLTLSFAANPHAPALAASRWAMAFALAGELDRSTRERAHLEFLSFFRRQPDAAVSIALRLDRLAELRALAGQDALDRQRLARAVERVRYNWAGA